MLNKRTITITTFKPTPLHRHIVLICFVTIFFFRPPRWLFFEDRPPITNLTCKPRIIAFLRITSTLERWEVIRSCCWYRLWLWRSLSSISAHLTFLQQAMPKHVTPLYGWSTPTRSNYVSFHSLSTKSHQILSPKNQQPPAKHSFLRKLFFIFIFFCDPF